MGVAAPDDVAGVAAGAADEDADVGAVAAVGAAGGDPEPHAARSDPRDKDAPATKKRPTTERRLKR